MKFKLSLMIMVFNSAVHAMGPKRPGRIKKRLMNSKLLMSSLMQKRMPKTIKGHAGPILSVALSKKEPKLVTGSRDETVAIWDIITGKALHRFRGYNNAVHSVALNSDETRLATGSWDGFVTIFDPKSGKQIEKIDVGTYVNQVTFCPDTTKLAIGFFDNCAQICDLKTNRTYKRFEGHNSASIALSPDGSMLAIASWNDVPIFNISSGKQLKVFKKDDKSINIGFSRNNNEPISVGFSPDNKVVAVGFFDGTARIYDLKKDTCKTLKGHTGEINGLKFSPDGSSLATVSEDATICLWDANNGKMFKQLKGHEGAVRCVDFNSDGTELATGSWDKTVRIWVLNDSNKYKTQ